MVATEAEYHANCLTSFYKLHLKYVDRSSQTTTSNHIHGIVFAEVVAYIEEARYDDDKPMFNPRGDHWAEFGPRDQCRLCAGRNSAQLGMTL